MRGENPLIVHSAARPSRRNARWVRRLLARRLSACLMAAAMLIGCGAAPSARAQQTSADSASAATPPCQKALMQAREDYFAARFDEAKALLGRCLEEGALTTQERPLAHALLGEIHLSTNLEAKARAEVRALLALAPDYQPDPETDSPAFTSLLAEVKRERRQQRAGESGARWKRWLLVGGGAAVALVVAVLLGTRGGGGGGQLPGPPPLPGN